MSVAIVLSRSGCAEEKSQDPEMERGTWCQRDRRAAEPQKQHGDGLQCLNCIEMPYLDVVGVDEHP